MSLSAWQISALHAPDLPTAVEVGEQGLTLGRDPSCDVVVPGAHWPGVSAVHARVSLDTELTVGGTSAALRIEDLDSKNGILVDGARVQSASLRHGGIFELGPGGPRFLALSTSRLDETLVMASPPAHAPAKLTRGLTSGLTTGAIERVRQDLGLPEEMGVEELIERRDDRQFRRVMFVAILLLGVAGVLFAVGFQRDKRNLEQQQGTLALQQGQLDDTQAALDAALSAVAQQRAGFDAARAAWEADREQLRSDRQDIEAAIARVEREGQSASGELVLLRTRLDETAGALQLYDPVNLELAKLHEVSRVEAAVVIFDVIERYRERTTGRLLYSSQDPADPDVITLNFKDRGTVFTSASSGSGFCISGDGWIVTNAHVVLKKLAKPIINLGPDIDLDLEVELQVVFSGKRRRHAAEVIDWAATGDQDLALVKIKPFDGLPWVPLPSLSTPPPPPGAEVFLLGFPLGRQAMQEGDTVIASTFRGIVSRTVSSFLQVDAAVHPGASGGPVIDGHGQVVGVVTGMQTLGDGQGSTAIGYVIPIEQLSPLWPPQS